MPELCALQACRSKGVDCVVAPYEADAQLAYLSRTGVAQIVITEDSDLILFGCEKVQDFFPSIHQKYSFIGSDLIGTDSVYQKGSLILSALT
jgi:5'-3' exonuclease